MSTTDEVHAIDADVNPTIFREYIGEKDYPANFTFPTEIINDKIPEFHFILGMATEDYVEGKGTGKFKPNWNAEHFGVEQVKCLKDAYSKVKVVISIGGRGPKFPFNPAAKEIWIENATNTIKSIIADYKHQGFNDGYGCSVIIDGIDINYEVVESSVDDFAHCIGELIKNVKDDFPRDRFVSIAPSDVSSKHYKRLYQEYTNEIDFVGYQFYNQKVSAKLEFVTLFRALSHDYSINKLLVGGSTDLRDPHGEMRKEFFVEGCKYLVSRKSLKGVFLWNANDDYSKVMQKILTHSDNHNPIIFREYIGVKNYPPNFTFPTEIINDKIPEFHFILGMATEDYVEGKGTGKFKPNWNAEHFGVEQVKCLKDAYSKVKVVISIGGRGPKFPFNPAAKEIWIENATNTIKSIIADYKHQGFNDGYGCNVIIDGIDINYEVVESSDGDFAHCIGELIKNVKDDFPRDRFVSIAPSEVSSKHYKRLYQEYTNEIDFVGYQFYNQKVSVKLDFVTLFRALSHDYSINKLLVGGSTDLRDPHGEMRKEFFVEGCKYLFSRKSLRGVFLWNANDSKVPLSNEQPFFLEGLMQKILTHSD